jgi:hypothetical protein
MCPGQPREIQDIVIADWDAVLLFPFVCLGPRGRSRFRSAAGVCAQTSMRVHPEQSLSVQVAPYWGTCRERYQSSKKKGAWVDCPLDDRHARPPTAGTIRFSGAGLNMLCAT